eukprot:jgi/Tetstr1/445613/TSEL_003418.t1
MEQSAYEQLLAESIRDTFDHPDGQTHGRRGRRCVLEDGERRLGCCIRARPSDLYPRLLLAKNLMRQGRGREADILPMVMAALWDADFEDESPEALALIKISCEALSTRLGRAEEIPRFLAAARQARPSLHPGMMLSAKDLIDTDPPECDINSW